MIWFFHLNNDYTGSTRVLDVVIRGIQNSYDFTLVTNNSEGLLSKYNTKSIQFAYDKEAAIGFRILQLLRYYIYSFILVGLKTKKDDILYINTILPQSVILASVVFRKRCILHVHEDLSLNKLLIKSGRIALKYISVEGIFVSDYTLGIAKNLKMKRKVVIRNCFDSSLSMNTSVKKLQERNIDFLLVSSFESYKGVFEFIEVARKLIDRTFCLVTSSSPRYVEKKLELNKVVLPDNVQITYSPKDLVTYYSLSKHLCVLSNPNYWIETFGLTILEGFAFGTPAIVPRYGGPIELIDGCKNGYFLPEKRNIENWAAFFEQCVEDSDSWKLKSKSALSFSYAHSETEFTKRVQSYLSDTK